MWMSDQMNIETDDMNMELVEPPNVQQFSISKGGTTRLEQSEPGMVRVRVRAPVRVHKPLPRAFRDVLPDDGVVKRPLLKVSEVSGLTQDIVHGMRMSAAKSKSKPKPRNDPYSVQSISNVYVDVELMHVKNVTLNLKATPSSKPTPSSSEPSLQPPHSSASSSPHAFEDDDEKDLNF